MKDFDPKKESKFITYLDANNLYGGQWEKDYQLMALNEWKIQS